MTNINPGGEFLKPRQVIIKLDPTLNVGDNADGSLLLFVSHSAKDEAFVRAFMNLLEKALPIEPDEVRCTTLESYALSWGADSGNQLCKETSSAKVFIALITPHSLNSRFVSFELGSRWGSGKPILALLAKGIEYKDLQPPLSSVHNLDCRKNEQLLKLLDDLAKASGRKLRPAQHYFPLIQPVLDAAKPEPSVPSDSAEPTPIRSSSANIETPRTQLLMLLRTVGAEDLVDRALKASSIDDLYSVFTRFRGRYAPQIMHQVLYVNNESLGMSPITDRQENDGLHITARNTWEDLVEYFSGN